MVYVSGAVEGPSDEAVLRRLIGDRGGLVHRVQVQGGKARLRRALPGYNADARRVPPWLATRCGRAAITKPRALPDAARRADGEMISLIADLPE